MCQCGFPLKDPNLKSLTLQVGNRGSTVLSTPSASAPLLNSSVEIAQGAQQKENKSFSRVGQKIGSYQLIRVLGEGGFAEVYLGEHIHLGSQAAIKILYNQLTHEDIDTFRSEARTLVRLIHPHIVRILDFGIENKIAFLVMDYAPNGTLRQRHPRGSVLSLPTVVSYVKQIAESLQFAHNEKIIHRDIKPENMPLETMRYC